MLTNYAYFKKLQIEIDKKFEELKKENMAMVGKILIPILMTYVFNFFKESKPNGAGYSFGQWVFIYSSEIILATLLLFCFSYVRNKFKIYIIDKIVYFKQNIFGIKFAFNDYKYIFNNFDNFYFNLLKELSLIKATFINKPNNSIDIFIILANNDLKLIAKDLFLVRTFIENYLSADDVEKKRILKKMKISDINNVIEKYNVMCRYFLKLIDCISSNRVDKISVDIAQNMEEIKNLQLNIAELL